MKFKTNPIAKALIIFKPKTVQMKTRYNRKSKNWKKEG